MDLTVVGVANYAEAEHVAKSMIEDGIAAIELCGGFGTDGVARIARAVGGKAAVGVVRFDGIRAWAARVAMPSSVTEACRASVPAEGVSIMALSSDARSGLPVVETYDYSLFGEVEVRPLNKIRRVIARRLYASWVNVPMVVQFDEADITELEALRTQLKPHAERKG